jgi:hypothetical protein
MRHRITACLVAFTAALIVAAPAAARSYIVAPPTPPSASCLKQVTFALLDARTSGCLVPVSTNPDVWESTDPVNVNGIPMQAVAGTKLVLKAPTTSIPGGAIAVSTSITLGGATVFSGSFDQALPAGGPGDLKPLATLSPPAGTKIKGFSLGGSVSVMLGKDATGDQQGYARFELIVKLPDAFKNGPGQGAGGLTGTAAIRTDATGVHADTLKLEISNAYVGQVLLKNVCLSYVAAASLASPCQPPKFGATPLLECKTTGTDRWDGSALIQLPTADKPDVGVFAGVSNGSFAYAGAQVTNLGNSAPLVQGVYLDKIGLAICVNPAPTTIKGAVGLRFGPSFNGTSAAYLNGSIQYTDSRPWVIQARGSLALYGKDVASGYLTYKSDGAIDFGFAVAWNFYGVLDLNGAVNGWYQPARTLTTYGLDLRDPVNQQRNAAYQTCVRNIFLCAITGRLGSSQAGLAQIPRIATGQTTEAAKFDVYGNAKVCVVKIVCVGGEAAVSSVGVAGCAEITVFGYPSPYFWGVRWVSVKIRAGAGYKWGSGRVDTMGSSCDVGGYRAQKSAQIAASGVTTIKLARAPAVALRITGRGGAPRVSFTSPDGSRIMVNRAGQLKRNKYYFVEDPRDDTTSIVIVRPAPGTWTIHTLPGSPTVTGAAEAPVTPDPSAAARVLDHGAMRELQYELESDPNHTVTFVERGGNYEQEIGTAHGTPCLKNAPIHGKRPANAYMAHPSITCGLIVFKPAAGPAGVRNIFAVVTDHGEPVDDFKVASYTARGEGIPARPANLRITRQGSTVQITWNPSAGADDYDVDVTLSDGAKVVDVMGSKARHVVLHGISPALGVSATVRGLRSDDVQGPATTASSKAH